MPFPDLVTSIYLATAKAPSGIKLPVLTSMQAPDGIRFSNVLPGPIAPLTVSETGVASPALAVSATLTRKPSTNALENGGESIAAVTSAARTRARAFPSSTLSTPTGPAGNPARNLSSAAATGSSGLSFIGRLLDISRNLLHRLKLDCMNPYTLRPSDMPGNIIDKNRLLRFYTGLTQGQPIDLRIRLAQPSLIRQHPSVKFMDQRESLFDIREMELIGIGQQKKCKILFKPLYQISNPFVLCKDLRPYPLELKKGNV